jgi:8-amino-7-oxononanoate synthase
MTTTAMTTTATHPLSWLDDAADARRAAGVHRELWSRTASPNGLNLASNDYLGLSRHHDVVDAAIEATRAFGAGSTGSRLVTGTTALHTELEDALAAFLGVEATLVFSSGYLANIGAVSALSGPGSLIVSDAGNHASLIDACRLSGARIVVVRSGDVDAVDRALAGRSEQRALVVTDAVFSVVGTLAPLAALHEVVRRHGATLVVDEAHAVGVIGPGGHGGCVAAGIAGEPDVVVTATLSKSLGGQGGLVAGLRSVRTHLIDTARSFIFDTGLAPGSAGAALTALTLVTPQRVSRLRARIDDLSGRLGLPPVDGAIVRVVLGDAQRAADARDKCGTDGVHVGCFRPPSVPSGEACLRLAARADLSPADVERAADVVLAACAVT